MGREIWGDKWENWLLKDGEGSVLQTLGLREHEYQAALLLWG